MAASITRSDTRAESGLAVVDVAAVDEIRTAPEGGVQVGLMCTVMDMAAATVAIPDIQPDWIATRDIAYRSFAPVVQGPLLVSAETIWVGEKTVVADCRTFDGLGQRDTDRARPCGLGTVAFARISGSATAVVPSNDEPELGRVPMFGEPARFTKPLRSAIGLGFGLVDDRPMVEVAKTPYVENSIGTINGGVMAVLVDAAAEQAAGEGFHSTGVDLRYLAQTAEGPARAFGEIVSRTATSATARVGVYDQSVVDDTGAARRVAIADVTLRRSA